MGLRNAQDVDQLIEPLCNSRIVKRIRILDLSLGTLSNEGAKHLVQLKGPEFALLELLDLHHHYITEPEIILALLALDCLVDLSGLDESNYRYVAVGE